METIFFWIAWFFVSFWVLRRYYFSYQKEKLNNLRLAALGINLAVLVLIFLPWAPGKTGWQLLMDGILALRLFFLLLGISLFSFFIGNEVFLKIGASSHLINSLLLIAAMIYLRPGSFRLTLADLAPAIAALMLLAGNVVVLLLWHQLQLKSRK